jgi:Flp pilus assembly protein TadD
MKHYKYAQKKKRVWRGNKDAAFHFSLSLYCVYHSIKMNVNMSDKRNIVLSAMKKTVIIGGVVALFGCSMAVMEGVRRAPQSDTSPPVATSFSRKAAFAYGNKYGNYLAGRTASIAGDHTRAAQFLGQIAYLEKEKAPYHVTFSAMRHYVLSGEIEKAMTLAHRVPLAEKPRPKNTSEVNEKVVTPPYNPLVEQATLLRFVQALHKGELSQARKERAAMQERGIGGLFIPFLESWLNYAENNKIARVTIADALPEGQFRTVQYYHEALQYTVAKDYTKAAKTYDALLMKLEHVPEMVVLSAVHFFATHGQEEKAVSLVKEYRAMHPRDAFWGLRDDAGYVAEIKAWDVLAVDNVAQGVAEALANVGQLLMVEGAHSEGQFLLQLARYLRPEHSFYGLILAQSLEDTDQHDAAAYMYAAISSPAWIEELVHMSQARVWHGKGDVEEARELLQEVAEKSAAGYNVQVMLGDLERGEKNYAEAAKHYSLALHAIGKPKAIDWPLIFRRGVVYDQLEQWDAAQKDFTHALELSPDEPEILNYLAYSWLLRGEKLEEAEAMLRRAVRAKPESAQIMDSYGWALYHKGEYKKALIILEKALSQIPADPTVNDHYGDALWRLGRQTEARFHWQRALVFKPTEKGAKAAIKEKLQHGLPEKAQRAVMR